MKISYKILAAAFGVAASIVLVPPQNAVGLFGLFGRNIGKVAQKITVRIDGPKNGSGAIIRKERNTYTVLTNCHVVDTPGNYTIQTYRGSSYTVNANPSMCQPGVDLAELQFTSTRRYRYADLGKSSKLVVGDQVYVSGWVNRDRDSKRGYRFFEGNIAGIQPNARDGYTLVHTINTKPGMSGGPILDKRGDLVGINGKGIPYLLGVMEFLGIAIDRYNPNAYKVLTNYVADDKRLTGHSQIVASVVISPDGELLASGSSDKTIKIWKLRRGKLERTLTGHSSWVNSVAISPDRQLLASGSSDKTINIWNLRRGKLVRTLTGHSYPVRTVAISPDGELLASGSDDNTIKIWNLESGRLVRTLTGHSADINSVAISPDGELLASGSDDKTIKIWNLESGRLVRTLTGHSYSVNGVAISPDGELLASGSDDNTIKIWNLESGRLVRTLTDHSAYVNSVAISPDGELLASGSNDKTIKIWNLRSGSLVRTLTGHSDSIRSVAFSTDGQTIASGGGCSWERCSQDFDIRIWRTQER